MERAGLGRRLAAISLDWIVALLTARLFARFSVLTSFERQFYPLLILFMEISILTALTGSSLGQRILKVKVVSEKGEPLKLSAVLFRTLLLCLVLPAVFMKEGKGYHDHFTRSEVILIRAN